MINKNLPLLLFFLLIILFLNCEDFYIEPLEDEIDITSYSFYLPKNPPTAGLLSAFIPGAGQIYNGKYLKASGVILIQGFLIGRTFYHDNKMNEYKVKRDNSEYHGRDYYYYQVLYNDSYEKRQSFIYWIGTSVFLSAMEALVDAHLINFKSVRNDIRLMFDNEMVYFSISF